MRRNAESRASSEEVRGMVTREVALAPAVGLRVIDGARVGSVGRGCPVGTRLPHETMPIQVGCWWLS